MIENNNKYPCSLHVAAVQSYHILTFASLENIPTNGIAGSGAYASSTFLIAAKLFSKVILLVYTPLHTICNSSHKYLVLLYCQR